MSDGEVAGGERGEAREHGRGRRHRRRAHALVADGLALPGSGRSD
jgi:hypothetical protein